MHAHEGAYRKGDRDKAARGNERQPHKREETQENAEEIHKKVEKETNELVITETRRHTGRHQTKRDKKQIEGLGFRV